MTQNYVSVVFDRKKKANTNKSGKGKIELYIRLNRECRKYLTIGEYTPAEWKTGLFATEAIEKQATYELKMVEFVKSGVEQSLDNLNRFLSIGQEAKKSDVVSVKPDVPKRKRGRPKNPLKESFLDFKLPKISNQKANDYLHIIESRLGINKSMTFHVARHSFATLSLSHDVPIEKVARMLGHTDIKTTQIYAKILKTTVEKHAFNLSNAIL